MVHVRTLTLAVEHQLGEGLHIVVSEAFLGPSLSQIRSKLQLNEEDKDSLAKNIVKMCSMPSPDKGNNLGGFLRLHPYAKYEIQRIFKLDNIAYKNVD